MPRSFWHQLWIALAAAVVFFTNLGATHLWDEDEALHASCARGMIVRGDWVTPTFNDELFPDKPPLTFWMSIFSFQVFGINEFAARLPSALCGLLTALVTYHLGRLLFGPRSGFWAGIIVASTVGLTVSARAVTMDAALVLFTTAALLSFVVGRLGVSGRSRSKSLGPWMYNPRLAWVAVYALLGLAVLTKGPIGIVLPMGILGLFLLVLRHWESETPAGRSAHPWYRRAVHELATCLRGRNVAWAIGEMRPLVAITVIAAVALPWYVWVDLRTHGLWLRQFLGEHNLGRALHPMQGHSGPIFYYVIAIVVGFFPWSVFLGPSLAQLGRRMMADPARRSYLFLACWIGVVFVFWSAVRTKLPHYVLPAYPALAMATGSFIDAWLAEPSLGKRWWNTSATITLIAAGLGIMVAMPIITARFLPGEAGLGAVGLVLVIGGAAYGWAVCRRRLDRAMAVLALTSIAFLVAVFGLAAVRVDRHQVAERLFAAIRAADPAAEVQTYRYTRPSLVFYAGRSVPHCGDPQALIAAAERHPRLTLITSDDFAPEVERLQPGRFQVVARYPKFLKRGEIVVLAGRAETAVVGRPPAPERR
jgi:4-amino-4-deoxy-L-arabinose transferase-like glycosyltransferase